MKEKLGKIEKQRQHQRLWKNPKEKQMQKQLWRFEENAVAKENCMLSAIMLDKHLPVRRSSPDLYSEKINKYILPLVNWIFEVSLKLKDLHFSYRSIN